MEIDLTFIHQVQDKGPNQELAQTTSQYGKQDKGKFYFQDRRKENPDIKVSDMGTARNGGSWQQRKNFDKESPSHGQNKDDLMPLMFLCLFIPRQGEGPRQGGGRRRSFRSRRVPLKDCCVSQFKHIVPTKPPKAPAAPKHQGSVKYGQQSSEVRQILFHFEL